MLDVHGCQSLITSKLKKVIFIILIFSNWLTFSPLFVVFSLYHIFLTFLGSRSDDKELSLLFATLL
jgi:hypothetical protein